MSWVPIVSSLTIGGGVLSVFLWDLEGLYYVVGALVVVVLHLVWTSAYSEFHYSTAFWIFIGSEVMAFGGVLAVVLWNQEVDSGHITSAFEIPGLGCVVLVCSSWAATAAHHHYWSWHGGLCLFVALVLGFVFIFFQGLEFYHCECDMTFSPYFMASFCAVGLHLIHVFLGWLALLVLFLDIKRMIGSHYVDVVIWYWHFVDYMWLIIFTIVYCL